jgi:hypothetical protein
MAVRDLTSKANKNKKAFEDLGIEVYDNQGKMKPLAAIIRDVEDAMKGKTDQEKRNILTQLGLQDRSIQAILTLVGNSDALREYTRVLNSAGGKTEEVAEKQMKSLENRLKQLRNTVQVASMAFGQALAPAIGLVASALGLILRLFVSLPQPLQQVIASLIMMKATFHLLNIALGTHLTLSGLALGAFNAFNWALGVTTGRMIVLSSVMPWLTGQMTALSVATHKANAALWALVAANPALIGISLGLAAVAAGLYLLGKGDMKRGAMRVVQWFTSIGHHIDSALHKLKSYVAYLSGDFERAAKEMNLARQASIRGDKEYYGKHYDDMKRKSRKHRQGELTGWRAHLTALANITVPGLLLLEHLHILSNKRTESGKKKSMNRRLKEGRRFSFDMVRAIIPGLNLLLLREKWNNAKREAAQKRSQKKRKGFAKTFSSWMIRQVKGLNKMLNGVNKRGAKRDENIMRKNARKRVGIAQWLYNKVRGVLKRLRKAAIRISRTMGMAITSIYRRITRYATRSARRLYRGVTSLARRTRARTVNIFTTMKNRVVRLFNDIKRGIRQATREWSRAVKSAVDKIKGHVGSGFDWVYNTVARAINAIVGILNKFLPGKSLKLEKVPTQMPGGGGGGKGRGQKGKGEPDWEETGAWADRMQDDESERQGLQMYLGHGGREGYDEAFWPTDKKAPKGGYWWFNPSHRDYNVRRFGDVPGVPPSTFKGRGEQSRYLADRDMAIEHLDRQTKGKGEKAYKQIYDRVLEMQAAGIHPADIDRELMQGGTMTIGGKTFDIAPGTISYLNLGNLYRRYGEHLWRGLPRKKKGFFSGPGDYLDYGFVPTGADDIDIFGTGGAEGIGGINAPKGNTLFHKVARAVIEFAKNAAREPAENLKKKDKKRRERGWGKYKPEYSEEYRNLKPKVRAWAKYLGGMFGAELVSGHRGSAKGLHAQGKAIDLRAAPKAMKDMVKWVRQNLPRVEVAHGGPKHRNHVHLGFAEQGMYAQEDTATVIHKKEMVLTACGYYGRVARVDRG